MKLSIKINSKTLNPLKSLAINPIEHNGFNIYSLQAVFEDSQKDEVVCHHVNIKNKALENIFLNLLNKNALNHF